MKNIKSIFLLFIISIPLFNHQLIAQETQSESMEKQKTIAECYIDNDCKSNDICNKSNNKCETCKSEGEIADNADMCCPGYWFWDKNKTGLGTEICSSEDPNHASLKYTVIELRESGRNLLNHIFEIIANLSLMGIFTSLIIYVYAKFKSKSKKKIGLAKNLFKKASFMLIISILLYKLVDFILSLTN